MNDSLPGALGIAFVISILDAALLSWVALRWYRGTVAKLMDLNGTAPAARSSTASARGRDPVWPASLPHLEFWSPPASTRAGRLPGPFAHTLISPIRLAAAYVCGAALFAAVIALAGAVESDAVRFNGVVALWWMNLWPIIPTLVVILVLDWKAGSRLLIGYIVIGAIALVTLGLVQEIWRGSMDVRHALMSAYWLVLGIILTASIPVALLLVTSWRRVRGIAPLALISTLVFGVWLAIFRSVLAGFSSSPAGARFLVNASAYLPPIGVIYALYMLGALPLGWLAWRLLRRVASAFQTKRFSDVQLVVDCWWLVVTAYSITQLVSGLGTIGILWGVAAFTAYRVGVECTLRLVVPAPDSRQVRLLLLRVFGFQSRTESLFDRVVQRWRFRGPVQVFSGPDLAMRLVAPGSILAFLGGRLSNEYVATAAEVPERMGLLDWKRDPDLRFRVNQVFCREEAWRPALQALLPLSDVVLMDLRGFSSSNQSAIFELEQLVTATSAERIVLICDGQTDFELLSERVGAAWEQAKRARPAHPYGPIKLFAVKRHSTREIDRLTDSLAGMFPPAVAVAAD